MDRKTYQDARRGYRLARRRDIEFREPEAWAYRERTLIHHIPPRPDFAIRYIRQFPHDVVETFFRPRLDAGRGNSRLPHGPRARALLVAKESGRFAGLNLPKRVAVRQAMRQMAERAA